MLCYSTVGRMKERTLKLVELFESLQGEGGNTGRLVVFVRLTGCNLSCSFCDTAYNMMTLELTPSELLARIQTDFPHCKSIIWTGGEPTLQLTQEIVQLFKASGYWQALESNGLKAAPLGLDYITLSPKGNTRPQVLEQYQDRQVGEVRIAIADGEALPAIEDLPQAEHYFLSPIFDGDTIVPANVSHCEALIRRDPRWRLSLQTHKLIGIR